MDTVVRRKPADQCKTKKFRVRATPEQYDYIKRKAAAANQNVTDFIWSSVFTRQVKGFNGKALLNSNDPIDVPNTRFKPLPCDSIKTKQIMMAVTPQQHSFMMAKSAAAQMTLIDFIITACEARKVGGFDED